MLLSLIQSKLKVLHYVLRLLYFIDKWGLSYRGENHSKIMKQIQGKLILLRVSASIKLSRVRVIGSQLHILAGFLLELNCKSPNVVCVDRVDCCLLEFHSPIVSCTAFSIEKTATTQTWSSNELLPVQTIYDKRYVYLIAFEVEFLSSLVELMERLFCDCPFIIWRPRFAVNMVALKWSTTLAL